MKLTTTWLQFLTLASMYQITKKGLSPDAQVENCVRGILDDFNRDPERFKETLPPARNVTDTTTNVTTTIRDPWKPCEDEARSINTPLRGFVSIVVPINIKNRFKCLYYSYRYKVLNGDTSTMKDLEENDNNKFCQGVWAQEFLNKPLFETVKEDQVDGGNGAATNCDDFFSGPCIGPPDAAAAFFNYKFPAILPSRVNRFKNGWLFDYDIYLEIDSTEAEDLIIDVFDQFSGCAVSTKFLRIM